MAACSMTEIGTLVALAVGFAGLFSGVIIGVFVAGRPKVQSPMDTNKDGWWRWRCDETGSGHIRNHRSNDRNRAFSNLRKAVDDPPA